MNSGIFNCSVCGKEVHLKNYLYQDGGAKLFLKLRESKSCSGCITTKEIEP